MECQIGDITRDFLSQEERARLAGLCRKLTGNADVAEDLAQETLLLAWRSLEGLREPEKHTQWLAGIARNVSLRWLRQQGRDQAHSLVLPQDSTESGTTSLEELVADEFDLEIELERRELVTLLDRALALLPAETRAVLVKRYIEESPLAEIAAQMDTNASAVAMRLQRGKLALRKVLTSEMQEELINSISLESLALFLPEGRAFSRTHPRIHQLPNRSIEFAGRPAIVTHFESLTESASFEVISDHETYEVLKIIGSSK